MTGTQIGPLRTFAVVVALYCTVLYSIVLHDTVLHYVMLFCVSEDVHIQNTLT